jgi:UDP-3-O-[3-hydroxymyristoyl] glucosamine N-acyltransferase
MLINSNGAVIRVIGRGTVTNDLLLMMQEIGQPAEAVDFEQAQQDSNYANYQYLLGVSRSHQLRTAIIDWFEQHNLHSPVLVHKQAYVADTNNLGPGTVVYPMASVLKSTVGRHVLLGVSAHIGHNSIVADRCVFLPYSVILGSVNLGFNTVLQATATVSDTVTISASHVNILPRSFVTKHIHSTGTYGGTPARRVNDHGVDTAEYFNS